MTDNEIIKDLEKEKYSFSDATRTYRVIEESIDLINRQKAEIERLKGELEQAKIEISKHFDYIDEAIKEFAERLTDKTEKARQKYIRLCKEQGEKVDEVMNIHFNGIAKIINDLVKEMTEE